MTDATNNSSGSTAGTSLNSPASQGNTGDESSAERTRRSAADIISELEAERDEKINKTRKDFAVKIAKARRNATPLAERRRSALDLLDRLRDAYRAAHDDILLQEPVVDDEIVDLVAASFERLAAANPAAYEAAISILNGSSGGEGDGEAHPHPGGSALQAGAEADSPKDGAGFATDDAAAGAPNAAVPATSTGVHAPADSATLVSGAPAGSASPVDGETSKAGQLLEI